MATTDSSFGAVSSQTPESPLSSTSGSQNPRDSTADIDIRATQGKSQSWRYQSYAPPVTDPERKEKQPAKARAAYQARKQRGPKAGRNTADLAKAAALASQVREEEEKAQAIIDNKKIAEREAKEEEKEQEAERKAAARVEKLARNQREAQLLGAETVTRMVWPNQKWQTYVHDFGKWRTLTYVGYVCLCCAIVMVQAVESALSFLPCTDAFCAESELVLGWGECSRFVPKWCPSHLLPVVTTTCITTIILYGLASLWLVRNYRFRRFNWRSEFVVLPEYTSVAREVDDKKARPQVWGMVETDSFMPYKSATFNIGLFQECCSIAGLGRSLDTLRSTFCRRINQLPEWRENLHTAYRSTLSVTAMLAADYVYESEQAVDFTGSGEALSLQRLLNTTSSATASQIGYSLLAIYAILNFQPMLWAIFLKLALGRLRRELFLCLLLAWRLVSQRVTPLVSLQAASIVTVALCRRLIEPFVVLWQHTFALGFGNMSDPPMTSMTH